MRRLRSGAGRSGGLSRPGARPPGMGSPDHVSGNQTPTKTRGGWDCQNNGGNTSNAENPKNPNKGKGDF